MAKNKKSKILASVLAVSTMAVFYAVPVFAAQEGLTANGENITAASSVTINGVTLTRNDLIAVDGTFTGAVSGKTGTFTGAVTAKGFTSNNGAIYVKNADTTNVFTADTKGNVTAAGAVKAASLSTSGNATVGGEITGKNGLDINTAANNSGTSGSLDIAAGRNSMQATYKTGDSTFTNTLSQSRGTTITATR